MVVLISASPDQRDGGEPSGNPDTTVDAVELPMTPAEPVTPFDLWLERGLHTLFDKVAQEPIPDSLLKIIEQDRDKS